MLFACIAVAVVVSGAVLLSLGDDAQQAGIPGASSDFGAPPMPHPIVGYTYSSDGVTPLGDCTVTITNVRLGISDVTTSDGTGLYQYDLVDMVEPYLVGDEILVEAEKDSMSGSSVGYVTAEPFDMINVTLDTVIPEFSMVIVPVVGMLALFTVVGLRRRKAKT
jgi:hypothetical protein